MSATQDKTSTDALLERLVALNTRRAAEEATGTVRWLRPEFQDPARRQAAAAPTTAPTARQPWPATLPEQMRAVADTLATIPAALPEATLGERFTGRGPWKKRLPQILQTLEALAVQGTVEGGWHSA